jgi:hypothetical protein
MTLFFCLKQLSNNNDGSLRKRGRKGMFTSWDLLEKRKRIRGQKWLLKRKK